MATFVVVVVELFVIVFNIIDIVVVDGVGGLNVIVVALLVVTDHIIFSCGQ